MAKRSVDSYLPMRRCRSRFRYGKALWPCDGRTGHFAPHQVRIVVKGGTIDITWGRGREILR